MATYEVIREIFNKCSGNQMRDVDVSEVEAASVDEVMDKFRNGTEIEEETTVKPDGSTVVDLTVNGLRQRFTITAV